MGTGGDNNRVRSHLLEKQNETKQMNKQKPKYPWECNSLAKIKLPLQQGWNSHMTLVIFPDD